MWTNFDKAMKNGMKEKSLGKLQLELQMIAKIIILRFRNVLGTVRKFHLLIK